MTIQSPTRRLLAATVLLAIAGAPLGAHAQAKAKPDPAGNTWSPGKHSRVTPGFFAEDRIISMSKAVKENPLVCVDYPCPDYILAAKFL